MSMNSKFGFFKKIFKKEDMADNREYPDDIDRFFSDEAEENNSESEFFVKNFSLAEQEDISDTEEREFSEDEAEFPEGYGENAVNKKLTKEEKEELKKEKRILKEQRLIRKYEEKITRREEHRKKTFKEILRDFVPWKGDEVSEIVRKSIMLAAIAAFLCSGTLLAIYGINSLNNLATGNSIKDLYGKTDIDLNSINLPDGANAADFAALYAENPDTVGWIYIPNTNVDNVVVKGEDNSYYLSHDFYGKSSEHGTIMADSRGVISLSGNSKNTVLYGHHMMDGSMFASLKKYRTFSFYKENPVINFDTLYGKGQYEIFSVFITNEQSDEDDGYRFNYNKVSFGTDTEFRHFITDVERRSIYNTNVTVSEDDEILTLSTCVYDFKEARLVICARKLRDGEEAADTSTATRNSKALYPQAWYDKHGGSKPEFEGYEDTVSPYNPPSSEPSDSSASSSDSSVTLPSISAPSTLTESLKPAVSSSEPSQGTTHTPSSGTTDSSQNPPESTPSVSTPEESGSSSQSADQSGGEESSHQPESAAEGGNESQ